MGEGKIVRFCTVVPLDWIFICGRRGLLNFSGDCSL
jgi:hypothetical protein